MPTGSKNPEVFGVVSIQTYSPGSYDDEQVAAFEWLGSIAARLLDREEEDKRFAEDLCGSPALSPDAIIVTAVRDIGSMRLEIDKARKDANLTAEKYASLLEGLSVKCARLQAGTAELMLAAHRECEAKFRSLTEREQKVALLMMRHMSNAKIAAELYISEDTVKKHVTRVLRKYGATQRALVISELRQYLGEDSCDV